MIAKIRRITIPTALVAFAGVASAADLSALYGSWGTQAQCAGLPHKPGGSVMAAPFKISPNWLQHGQIWCALNWFPAQTREDGLFITARAICGEDGPQSYWLAFLLEGAPANPALTLFWNETNQSGPLGFCAD